MNALAVIEPEKLSTLLSYDPATGKLFWLPRPAEMFLTQKSAQTWNTRYSGAEAFTTLNASGYYHGTLFGRTHAAHRVAWALAHGAWPEGEIDHINGDPADNRIANLRDVTQSMNMRNQAPRSDNRSGYAGVRWCRFSERWIATLHIGRFATREEAIAARDTARLGLGYTGRSDRDG